MQKLRYFDECKWQDAGDGMLFQFLDRAGERLAEASLVDSDSKLWKFEVFVPERFQLEGKNAAGLVFSSAAAKKVAEMILLNTIVQRA